MGLNIDLVSQFAKLTANKKETKKESTAWGEVVEITSSGKCFVKLDGSDRVTPVDTITEAKVGDRVSVTIKNHAATLTGNTSSPSINADGSTVGAIKNDFNNLSADNLLIREKLTASEGYIAELSAKNVKIEETLEANEGKFEYLEAGVAEFKRLKGTYATFEQLTAKDAEFRNLLSDYATIENLNANRAEINTLLANKASIADLSAIQGTIGSLDAGIADIKTLIFGTASGTSIHTNFANAVIAQLGDAQIKSAMIQDISASKITAGEIITDNVKVKSADGSLLIEGPVLQIGDGVRARIQIGKDASGKYSFAIFDKDGNPLFYEDGITGNAIPDQIITNDMVANDAAIDANKLNIDKLFEVINEDGSHTLKSTKVKFDEEGQTLDVVFGALTSKVDNISVGGRNLLVNTTKNGSPVHLVGCAPTYLSTITNISNEDGVLALTGLGTDREIYYRFMSTASNDLHGLEPGKSYTFSGKAKITTTSGTLVALRARSQDIVGAWGGGHSVDILTEDTDEWVSFVSTFKIREAATGVYTSVQVYFTDSWSGVVYLKDLKFEEGTLATSWTPAPEDVDAQVSTLTSQYHDLSITIDTFTSSITEQTQQISDDVTSLSTQYSTLEQTLDSVSATVDKHTTDIKNKADGTVVTTLSNQISDLVVDLNGFRTNVSETYTTKEEFANLATRMTSAETSINQTKNDITLYATKTEVNDWFDGATEQFGGAISMLSEELFNSYSKGRNLLRNTGGGGDVAIAYGNANAVMSSVTSRTNENGIQTLTASANNREIYYRFMPVENSNLHGLVPGETYILSGKVRISTTSGSFNSLKVRTQHYAKAGWVTETERGDALESVASFATSSWINFSKTFTIPSDAVGYFVSFQMFYTENDMVNGAWSGTIEFKELKLEKVNALAPYPTPWSLAPEDISGYYSKTQTDAKIKIASDSITQTVSETYATKNSLTSAVSEIQQTSDSIKLSVEKISRTGRNLIRGSSQKDIEVGGYPTSGYDDPPAPFSGRTTIIPSGNEYVMSFEAKSTVNNDKIRCYFYSPNTTTRGETSQGIVTTAPDGWCNITLSTEWKRYWVKYTHDGAATTSDKAYIVGRRVAGDGSGIVSIRCVKLEEGHDPTPWSAAPEDTRSNFANDSSNVTITNGAITFETGTLLINAGNFTLDANGNITATNATLEGTVNTVYNKQRATLTSGELTFYYDGNKQGLISSKYHPNATEYGLTLRIPSLYENSLTSLTFVHEVGSEGSGYVVDYQMHNFEDDGVSGSYDSAEVYARHAFWGGMRLYGGLFVSGQIYPTGMIYLRNQCAIGWYDKDKGGPRQLLSFDNENVFTVGSNSYFTDIHKLTLPNGISKGLFIKNADASTRLRIIEVNNENKLNIGYGLYAKNDADYVTELFASAKIAFTIRGESIIFESSSNASYSAYIYPTSHEECCLGKVTNRWYGVYTNRVNYITLTEASDRRLKKNIEVLSDVHSELFDKFQPVQYKFIDGDDRIRYGLIAQDVEAAMVELGIKADDISLVYHEYAVDSITGELTDEYSISYTNIISMLIHEVQKLKHEIKTLKGE